MDTELLFTELYTENSMKTFVTRHLKKLEHITLMEIINQTLYRNVFVKFVEQLHPIIETEAIIALKRFILCQKILKNNDLFDNLIIFERLIELSPSYACEQKLRDLFHLGTRDLNFIHILERLKWKTIIELICHTDYKNFLTAIRQKSNQIKSIFRTIY